MPSFRDYLKTHPKAFEKYAEVKKQAVEVANQDKEIYINIKEPFILEIIKKAITT